MDEGIVIVAIVAVSILSMFLILIHASETAGARQLECVKIMQAKPAIEIRLVCGHD